MIVFWIICAVLVAIALAFIIPPLLQRAGKEPANTDTEANIDVYRDQIAELDSDLRNGLISSEQHQRDRDEIERRLLEDVAQSEQSFERSMGKRNLAGGRGLVYAVALIIPAFAVAMYLRVGNPAAISAAGAPAPATARSSQRDSSTTQQGMRQQGMRQQGMTQQGIEANVATLAKRLQENPNDLQGWTMLGRSYLTLGRYEEASKSYSKATELKPDDADLWADYAFALAMHNGKRLEGQPQQLINKALSLDPENPKALELAGSAAFESKNYTEAINYWQRLLARTPADSELAKALIERINEAKALASSGAN